VAAEDGVEELLARQQPAMRAQQRVEDLELGVGERELGTGELGAPGVGVDAQRAVRDQRARRAVELHAAQDRAHAAAQLGDPDRLGHVVVGARLEREHRVGLAVASRHRHHVRALARTAQAPADLDAVGPGPEADVEQDEIERLGGERVQRGAAVRRLDDDMAVAGQRADHHLAQVRVVLDDEDATPQSAVAVLAEHSAQA
jgi:hypothetical protein